MVVRDDAGHKTEIRSDSSGEVSEVEVNEDFLGGKTRRTAQLRSRRLGGVSRQGLVVTLVAAVAFLVVLGIVAALAVRKPPGKAEASASGAQVLSSNYSASPFAADHTCAPRSLVITWTLRGTGPRTPTTVKVTGTGPTEQFNAPVGADGKTVRVYMSFQTPSRWNVEIIAVDGKLVRPPATNPAGAITLAC